MIQENGGWTGGSDQNPHPQLQKSLAPKHQMPSGRMIPVNESIKYVNDLYLMVSKKMSQTCRKTVSVSVQ